MTKLKTEFLHIFGMYLKVGIVSLTHNASKSSTIGNAMIRGVPGVIFRRCANSFSIGFLYSQFLKRLKSLVVLDFTGVLKHIRLPQWYQ